MADVTTGKILDFQKRANAKDVGASQTLIELGESLGLGEDFIIQEQFKAQIGVYIIRILRAKGMVKQQAKNSKILGMTQSDFSKLINGKVSKFSTGKLIEIYQKLGGVVSVEEPKLTG